MTRVIFQSKSVVSIPTKDILSYIFDEQKYDQDEPIYIDAYNPSRSISRNQARLIIRQLVAGFHAVGLKNGDCVAVNAFNDVSFLSLIYFGSFPCSSFGNLGLDLLFYSGFRYLAAGGIFTGTNPMYTHFELSHHIKTAKAKFFISELESLPPLLSASRENNIPVQQIWIFDTRGQKMTAGLQSWMELLSHGEEDWIRFNALKHSQETTAARLFSSGTTGLPKATIISHYNFVAQHELVYEINPRPYRMRRIVELPLFHAAADLSTHVTTLKAGHVIFIMRRFEIESFLKMVDEFNVTDLTLVPPMALAIIRSPLSKNGQFLKKVKAAACGAAPLNKDIQAIFRSFLEEGAPFTQVWGMTETSCVATMFSYPEHDTTGSVGRLLPNIQAKLIDDDGNDISAYNVRGELCIRGPTVTPGYFDNAAANRESFDADGWFKTGDIAFCNEETCKWYIVDRKKELIKVRGFQVAPPELEAVLLSHRDIADAAVIGIRSSLDDGELPRAYVVRAQTERWKRLTEDEVKEFLAGKLAKYKALAGGVQFRDVIPKNPSGKILKRLLREEATKEIEATAAAAQTKL